MSLIFVNKGEQLKYLLLLEKNLEIPQEKGSIKKITIYVFKK